MRISDGKNPLDNTGVHPESYDICKKMLDTLGYSLDDIKNKIESNQIGKFSTYNVASLLQNIIKIIPTNVRLVNISSNDNKYVTIKASSTEYEDLGYFFAQIKLENVLNNAKIVKVENGETTTVEIGGDLP